MENIQKQKKCCDTCKYYEWYYDKCNKYDCEVDDRQICSMYESRNKNEKVQYYLNNGATLKLAEHLAKLKMLEAQ